MRRSGRRCLRRITHVCVASDGVAWCLFHRGALAQRDEETGMTMRLDLHMHSTASDGTYAPQVVMEKAAEAGMALAALTDHDTLEGLLPAGRTADEARLPMIYGIELSVGGEKEVHLLGYGVDPQDSALRTFCEQRRKERTGRVEEMISRLQKIGVSLQMDDVKGFAKGNLSRAHVAQALVQKGYSTTIQAAFQTYLQEGKCAYVPREEVPLRSACDLLRAGGALPVIAHPMLLRMGEGLLKKRIVQWKDEGLMGVEVYHTSHAHNHAAFLGRFARAHGLLVTGGSDFHGEALRNVNIGQGMERWQHIEEDARILYESIAPHGRNTIHFV